MMQTYGTKHMIIEFGSCEICKDFKCTSPQPAASSFLAKNFNDAVVIDLKCWNGTHYILCRVDLLQNLH